MYDENEEESIAKKYGSKIRHNGASAATMGKPTTQIFACLQLQFCTLFENVFHFCRFHSGSLILSTK